MSSTSHSMTNPVLTAAHEDYVPDLVAIQPDALAGAVSNIALDGIGPLLEPGATLCGRLDELQADGIVTLIVLNSLNFQYWDVNDWGDFSRYRHRGLDGALAMQDSFFRAWEGAHRTAAGAAPGARTECVANAFRKLLAREGIAGLFGAIPAADLRAHILAEVLDDPQQLDAIAADIKSRLLLQGSLTWREAQDLADAFPLAYGDRYLKKAQLTMINIAAQWMATPGNKPCMLDVTAAADYQLPKVLRAMGILTYSPRLAVQVDLQEPVPADSREERAIRAATVLACEQLAPHLGCTIPEVDFWLWANRNNFGPSPFHLTRTTNY